MWGWHNVRPAVIQAPQAPPDRGKAFFLQIPARWHERVFLNSLADLPQVFIRRYTFNSRAAGIPLQVIEHIDY